MSHIPPTGVLAIVGGAFVFFFVLEQSSPLRRRSQALGPRLLLNLAVSAMAFAAAAFIISPVVMTLLQWTDARSFGLVHIGRWPTALQVVAGFLLMDLSFYYWHILNHKVPFLWRFHNVHHIDPDLDVSTGFRFHFGEIAFSAAFRATQVTFIGLSVWTYAAYELVYQLNTLFHHSNVRLPIRLERLLNKVLVTPRMHGIHHSEQRDEANSNYSVVFSWWDRINRTLAVNVPQSQIVIGVPGYRLSQDNRFWTAFLLPFRKQRAYWLNPDGTPVQSANRAKHTAQPEWLAE